MTDKLWHDRTKHPCFGVGGYAVYRSLTAVNNSCYIENGATSEPDGDWAYKKELIAAAESTTVLQKKLDKATEIIIGAAERRGVELINWCNTGLKEIEDIKEE